MPVKICRTGKFLHWILILPKTELYRISDEIKKQNLIYETIFQYYHTEKYESFSKMHQWFARLKALQIFSIVWHKFSLLLRSMSLKITKSTVFQHRKFWLLHIKITKRNINPKDLIRSRLGNHNSSPIVLDLVTSPRLSPARIRSCVKFKFYITPFSLLYTISNYIEF